jgi:simple sugar transport system substrate-binding protein
MSKTLLGVSLLVGLVLQVGAGCGSTGNHALPSRPGLPAIGANPAIAPVGAAAGVNIFGLTGQVLRFVIVTDRPASDPFWAVVQHGAQAAARELGVSVTYEAPDTSDIARMRQLIQAAIATKPAGLVVSLPNPAALAPAIHAAERAGTPIIAINAGSDAFRKLGILLYVGEDEYQSGFAAGQRMRAHGVRRVLCIIQEEADNLALQQRCRGFAAAIAEVGGQSSNLSVSLQDPSAVEQRIAAELDRGRFDGLLTLGGASIAGPALTALRTDHLLGRLTYAAFGIDSQVLKAVLVGQISFAVDQQPYLQGYLPIVLLTQYQLYDALPDRGRVISVGPVFITKQNASRVLALVNKGVR